MSISQIIKYLHSGKADPIFYLLFAISVTAIIVALYTQFILGYPPCTLCLYERLPYLALSKIAFSGALVTRFEKFWMRCAIITLFIATSISAYHSGVERGLFNASSQCNPATKITDEMTNEEALLALDNQPVATCTVAPFKILMLSMAEWNLLLNLGLLILVSVNYVRRFHAKT